MTFEILPHVYRRLARYKANQLPEDAEFLIEQFQPFILNWVKFLRSPFISETDPQFIGFLKFFHLHGTFSDKHEFIRKSLRAYESDDIIQEINLAFLESCQVSDYPS